MVYRSTVTISHNLIKLRLTRRSGAWRIVRPTRILSSTTGLRQTHKAELALAPTTRHLLTTGNMRDQNTAMWACADRGNFDFRVAHFDFGALQQVANAGIGSVAITCNVLIFLVLSIISIISINLYSISSIEFSIILILSSYVYDLSWSMCLLHIYQIYIYIYQIII